MNPLRPLLSAFQDPQTVAIANRTFDVSVNRLKRARRLTMRVDTHKRLVRISAPQYVDAATLDAFLQRNQAWLEKQVEQRPDAQFVQDGSIIPFRGQAREVTIRDKVPTISVEQPGLILLPRRGEPILRLQRFLIQEASKDLQARAERLSQRLGLPFRSLRVRDTKTRWGSCSSKAGLNFSWRLIFAEDWVREYVVAHEVAHLRHMDHSAAFWAQCQALCPHDLSIEAAKTVLRQQGHQWHALIFDGSADR